MVAVRHLAKPPIAEAAIRFQVHLSQEPVSADFAGVAEDVKSALFAKFPHREELRRRQLELKIGPVIGEKLSSADSFEGMRLRSDGNLVAMFRRDLFIVSHVGEYDTFERLIEDAQEAWRLYSALMKPDQVIGVGLRYINRIPLTLPAQMKDYFTAVAELPAELEQDVESYMYQATVPFRMDTLDGKVRLVQLMESGADQVAAILDIDVSASISADPVSNELWEVLHRFRACKNRYFFGLVTEKTLEPFL